MLSALINDLSRWTTSRLSTRHTPKPFNRLENTDGMLLKYSWRRDNIGWIFEVLFWTAHLDNMEDM